MHDSIRLENLGIPTVAVITDVFRAAARAQASALRRQDFEAVLVPHPVQDRSTEEIAAKADEAVDEVVAHLLGADSERAAASGR